MFLVTQNFAFVSLNLIVRVDGYVGYKHSASDLSAVFLRAPRRPGELERETYFCIEYNIAYLKANNRSITLGTETNSY